MKLIEVIAAKVQGKIYEGYSGRGMFGATCWGITVSKSDVNKTIKVAEKLGLKNARIDDMGLDMIVYWPSTSDRKKTK